MKIIFFEVQEWEKNLLKKHFPQALFLEEKLSEENVKQYQDAEAISCFIYSILNKSVLEQLPHLKYIATRSTGFDHIAIAECKSRKIQVANVPEYGSNTVAEFTFALLLDVTRKITQSVVQAKQMNFEHFAIRGADLYGKTIGIIGFGKIGKNVVHIARGFGMKALVYTHTQDDLLAKQLGFQYVSLNELLEASDVITLHLPLTKETHHIINSSSIEKCKKGSFLINTARGGLIDTKAVLIGLEKEILAGVGLDVLEGEDDFIDEVAVLNDASHTEKQLKMLFYNHMLLNHPKVLITPHNAFNSQEALLRILTVSIENIEMFLQHEPENLVTQ